MITLKTKYPKSRKRFIHRAPKIYLRTPRIKPRPEIPIRKLIIFTLIVLIIGGLFYWLFLSGELLIKNIIVVDNHKLTQKEIEESLSDLLKENFWSNNLLFLNRRKAKEKLIKDFKIIKDLEIAKKFPDTLKIKVQERVPSIIYETKNHQKYLIDNEGIVLSDYNPKRDSEYSNLPLIIDESKASAEINQKIFGKNFVTFVQNSLKFLSQRVSLHAQKIIIPETIFEIEVVTTEGLKIYLDTSREPALQITNLERVLAEITKQKKDISEIDYIDLRIPNKIFYKYK